MIKLRYPVNFIGITQIFKKNKHLGVDLGWNSKYGGKNQPIYAAYDGKVIKTVDNDKSKKSWGNLIKIDHGNNIYTLYGHLKDGLLVKKNQKVKQGEIIAYMGSTGNSTGNHLHYELYIGGKDTSYRSDPTTYTYVYTDQIVASSTQKEMDLNYYNPTVPEEKKYIKINTKSGVWSRKGIGFSYKKYIAIPNGSICELLDKNIKKSNGYKWDKVIYNNEEVYLPNKWNIYL